MRTLNKVNSVKKNSIEAYKVCVCGCGCKCIPNNLQANGRTGGSTSVSSANYKSTK